MRSQQSPWTKPAFVIAAAALAIQPAQGTAPAAAQSGTSIQIQPLAADIPGGAQNANLMQAAVFAWQEFIGLNWPAAAGTRETPDTNQFFGQNGTAGGSPLVWETLRAKVELFPGNGSVSQGPHGWSRPGGGYDEPPDYVYLPGAGNPPEKPGVGTPDGRVAACAGQQPPAQPAWINLDETTQIGLDTMYAGLLPSSGSGGNTAPQLIRFMAKANSVEYAYVLANEFWYQSAGLTAAQTNFKSAVSANQPPQQPYVFFPFGTIEVKAAWRPLAPADNPAHFHTATVRFYETGANNHPCYFEAQWALIALHIIQKTPTAPAFIFATFEQAENILTADGTRVENVDGAVIINPPPYPLTTPAQTYLDSATDPQVSIVGSTYCTPQQQLFYRETKGNSGVPGGGDKNVDGICVARRFNDIPPPIILVNQSAHTAIAQYTAANKVANSPWAYYKLVNVQAEPFDQSQIVVNDDKSKYSPATFYQANSVVETDYTLGNFNGRIKDRDGKTDKKIPFNGAFTDYFPPPPSPPPPGFKNVYLFKPVVPSNESFNMGGCMGCHGIAQSVTGSDFSFILAGSSVYSPDTPAPAAAAEIARNYHALFAHP